MTPEAERRRRIAFARLAERTRRISLIRRSVVAGAAATFVLAWGLALGNQLAHGTKMHPGDSSATTGGQGPVSGVEGESTEDGVVPVDPAPASVAPVTPAPAPAPLTTSQS
jgi:hypothetical protein